MNTHVKNLNVQDFTLSDILDIFEELLYFAKNHVERMIDVDKKELANYNLKAIQEGVVEKLVEHLDIPKGYHIAYKKLDNHMFAKEIFTLFFKGHLSRKEVEYFLKYLTSEDQFRFNE